MENEPKAGEVGRQLYWNEYYRQSAADLATPSQFALFVLGEMERGSPVVDFGCGTGRDSLYFATQGCSVLGVDGSAAAVAHCQQIATRNGLSGAKFMASKIDDRDLADRVREKIGEGSPTLYARFFIHAINDAEEIAFLDMAAKLCRSGGLLAVEFRTVRDAQQAKVTSAHYRRFVDPLKFIGNAIAVGFECIYFVEGFGYAKYKDDDAHVARCVLRR